MNVKDNDECVIYEICSEYTRNFLPSAFYLWA
jgi:hypothetical protein